MAAKEAGRAIYGGKIPPKISEGGVVAEGFGGHERVQEDGVSLQLGRKTSYKAQEAGEACQSDWSRVGALHSVSMLCLSTGRRMKASKLSAKVLGATIILLCMRSGATQGIGEFYARADAESIPHRDGEFWRYGRYEDLNFELSIISSSRRSVKLQFNIPSPKGRQGMCSMHTRLTLAPSLL